MLEVRFCALAVREGGKVDGVLNAEVMRGSSAAWVDDEARSHPTLNTGQSLRPGSGRYHNARSRIPTRNTK